MEGQKITDRDIKVIVDLYEYRYLKSSQIKQLYFPSLQTANRRLRTMSSQGHLKSFMVPNIPERVWCLDKRGAQLTADELGISIEELRWSQNTSQPKDYYFLRHFLGINQFRIYLTLACDSSEIKLLGFIPEHFGERTEKGGMIKIIKDSVCDIRNTSEVISHTPDGVFALGKKGKPALFFLEIDRGTEQISNPEKGVLKALIFYLNYLLGGKYKKYQHDFHSQEFECFRVLMVTTSRKRLNHIREVGRDLDFEYPQAKKFIWITNDDQMNQGTVFQDIWQSIDGDDNIFYSID